MTLRGSSRRQFSKSLTKPDDPNQLYLARLSPAERDAFDLALHGEYFLNPETGFLELGGCFAEAQEEIYGETNELWEELSTQIEDLEARFEELRVAAADADCGSEHLGQLDAWRTEIETDWATEHQDLLDDAMSTDRLHTVVLDTSIRSTGDRASVGDHST